MSKVEYTTLFNYQVIVGDKNLSKLLMQPIIDSGYKNYPSQTEIQQISAVMDTENDRFIRLIFNTGNVFPLPPNLIDTKNGGKIRNKRKQTEIEPKFFYGLMDCQTGEVWLEYNKSNIFKDALKNFYPDEHIEIKQIIDEEQFINTLQELNEIKLSMKPDLLHTSSLNEHLQYDIYQFGASSAQIIFKYKEPLDLNRIKSIAKKLLGHKRDYKKLIISGRNVNNLEMVFNTDKVSSKISIRSPIDENGLIKENELFREATLKILDLDR